MPRGRLECYSGRLPASHLGLDSFLSSYDFWFVHLVARFVNEQITAHRARLTSVVAFTSGSMTLDSCSIVELSSTANREGTLSTANSKQKWRLCVWLWYLITICLRVNYKNTLPACEIIILHGISYMVSLTLSSRVLRLRFFVVYQNDTICHLPRALWAQQYHHFFAFWSSPTGLRCCWVSCTRRIVSVISYGVRRLGLCG